MPSTRGTGLKTICFYSAALTSTSAARCRDPNETCCRTSGQCHYVINYIALVAT